MKKLQGNNKQPLVILNHMPCCRLVVPCLEGLWAHVINSAELLISAKLDLQQLYPKKKVGSKQGEQHVAPESGWGKETSRLKGAAEALVEAAAAAYDECDATGGKSHGNMHQLLCSRSRSGLQRAAASLPFPSHSLQHAGRPSCTV